MIFYITIFTIILLIITIICVICVRNFENYENYDPILEICNSNTNKFYTTLYDFHLQCKSNIQQFDPNIPIFYINMDKSVNRRRNMEFQFRIANVPEWTRISGIDGSKLQLDKDSNITQNELGCTLSHIKAIETAYTQNLPMAIIMEDDCYFMHMGIFIKRLNKLIKNAPSDWTLLNLGPSHINCNDLFKSQTYIPFKKCNCYLATAYIINHKGMKNVLKNNKITPREAADVYIFDKAGATYHCEPNTIFPINDDKHITSQIQSSDDLKNQITNAHAILKTFVKNCQ